MPTALLCRHLSNPAKETFFAKENPRGRRSIPIAWRLCFPLGRDWNVMNHDGFSSVVREPFLSTFTPCQPSNAQSPACKLTAFSLFLRGSLKSHLITMLRKPLRAIQCHRARIRQEGCRIRSSGPEDIRTMSEGHRDLHNKGQYE